MTPRRTRDKYSKSYHQEGRAQSKKKKIRNESIELFFYYSILCITEIIHTGFNVKRKLRVLLLSSNGYTIMYCSSKITWSLSQSGTTRRKSINKKSPLHPYFQQSESVDAPC